MIFVACLLLTLVIQKSTATVCLLIKVLSVCCGLCWLLLVVCSISEVCGCYLLAARASKLVLLSMSDCLNGQGEQYCRLVELLCCLLKSCSHTQYDTNSCHQIQMCSESGLLFGPQPESVGCLRPVLNSIFTQVLRFAVKSVSQLELCIEASRSRVLKQVYYSRMLVAITATTIDAVQQRR